MAHLHRTVLAIAAYREKHGSWPTQLRLGPEQVEQISKNDGPEVLRKLAERMEVRVIPEWAISVGGLSVFRYGEDELGFDLDGSKTHPAEDGYRWLGIERKRTE